MNIQNNMAPFLSRLFDAWNAADIRYLILRNYEELPEHTGNDVDILVDPNRLEDAQQVLEAVAIQNSWRLYNVGEFACLSLFFFHKETLEQLHIDLMSGLSWRAFKFLDEQVVLDARRGLGNFHIPDSIHETVVNLMTRLIYGGYVKEKYREGIRLTALDRRQELVEALALWMGDGLADGIAGFAALGEWKQVEGLTGSVRKRIVLANLRKPILLSSALWNDACRLMNRMMWSPGVSIVVLGPDGCGKTSVANGLKVALDKTFYPEKGAHFHWKPIPQHGSTAPTEDPHGKMPRTRLLSLAYFTYHCIAFIWGWWRYVKPVLFRNGLVVIDRYYYDFFVDQRRYRLNLPQWMVRLGFVFVKKTDLVFCLDADPELLQARKKEVSFEECNRQRNAYRTMAENLPNGHMIDASQSLENVVKNVQRTVLEFMEMRAKARKPAGMCRQGNEGVNFAAICDDSHL